MTQRLHLSFSPENTNPNKPELFDQNEVEVDIVEMSQHNLFFQHKNANSLLQSSVFSKKEVWGSVSWGPKDHMCQRCVVLWSLAFSTSSFCISTWNYALFGPTIKKDYSKCFQFLSTYSLVIIHVFTGFVQVSTQIKIIYDLVYLQSSSVELRRRKTEARPSYMWLVNSYLL